MFNTVTFLFICTASIFFKTSTTLPQHVTHFQDDSNDRRHILLWLPSENTNIEEDLLSNESGKPPSAGLVKMSDNGSWNNVKRQAVDFTPRLGKRWDEEIGNSLENSEKDSFSKKIRSLFIPRLGKDLTLFQPRLG